MRITWTPDPAIGVDLRLDGTADLGVTAGGDLDLVGNAVPAENVWQATLLRLMTTLGTYLFQSRYGTLLRKSVDAPMTVALEQQIRSTVNATVLGDRRVKQITRLAVSQTADPPGYQIALAFVTQSSQPFAGTISVKQ